MPLAFLTTGPTHAAFHFLCAHGAGAGMETPFLEAVAGLLAERDIATLRFEFGYMAARRAGRLAEAPAEGRAAHGRVSRGRRGGRPRARRC